MKILIDARMVGPENTRGIGRYTEELIRAMAKVAPQNHYSLIVRRPLPHLTEEFLNIQTVIADVPWYGWREQCLLTGIINKNASDIVHIPHWNVPYVYNGPLVITIHDLLLKHFPTSAHSSLRSWPLRKIKQMGYSLVLDGAVKKARAVCVPTEFTKNDLLSFYPRAAGKAVVTGEGIDHILERSADNQVEDLACFKSSVTDSASSYLLYVGSAYPHKRLDLLLEAWKSLSGIYPGLKLKIAGELDRFMAHYQRKFSFDEQKVVFLGRVADYELKKCYKNAMVTVFPSSFEGFGFPPLEALVSGCPVVSSDAASMPEVLGKKGVVYFKNGSKDDMINAIKAVVDNHGYYREQAKQAGPELAVKHSWKRVAEITLDTYRLAALSLRRHGQTEKD